VITTCKELIVDKPFERFAEAVTRQLLGTNLGIPLLHELSALPSYGKLHPLQPIQPMNFINVLCKGSSFEGTQEGDPVAETREHRTESKR
jgi:hypothetical protein